MTKKAKITIGVVGGVLLLGGIGSLSNNTDKNSTSSPTSNISSYSSIYSSTPLNSSDTNQAEIPEPRETAIGKSDKSVDGLITIKATTVRNDKTGNWRYSGFSESGVDISEYALSYYNEYFESDKEIHAVINFANKTTTRISCFGEMLFVTVLKYVEKEEHDANIMFSGEVIKDYIIYTDNGDIEDITEPEIPNSSTSEPVSSVSSVESAQSSTQSAPESTPISTVPNTTTSTTPSTPQYKPSVVYIAATGNGTKYHKDPNCSKMNGNVIEMTKDEAEAAGYSPCRQKRCYG